MNTKPNLVNLSAATQPLATPISELSKLQRQPSSRPVDASSRDDRRSVRPDTKTSPLSMTTAGGLHEDESGTNPPIDLVKINGVTASVNNGSAGSGVLRVAITNDSTGQVAISNTPDVNVSKISGTATSVARLLLSELASLPISPCVSTDKPA